MNELTPERLAELRKIAEAATPGEWEARKTRFFNTPAEHQYVVVGTEHFSIASLTGSAGCEIIPDAIHIAAFDPPTARALIAAAEELEEWREYFGCESKEDVLAQEFTGKHALRRQADAMREALEQVQEDWKDFDPFALSARIQDTKQKVQAALRGEA